MSEQPVRTVVRALGRFFNSAMLVVAALVGVALVLIAIGQVSEYYSVTIPTRLVTVHEFEVRSKVCTDPAYPVLIAFKNGSARTVLAVHFTFEAYYPGRSTDLAEFNYLNDDFIRKPGEAKGACWTFPALQDASIKRSDVELRLRISSVDFAN